MINKDKNLTNDTVQNRSKILSGIVVSDKQDKTVTVEVVNFIKSPKYGKFIKRNKKYKAHDEENQYKEGDKIVIKECRPMSKDKTFIALGKEGMVLENN
ncbi:MAG: 30S ribosomal protein S17 [Parcubacteria group bacterium CG10_big_fil_rev_8_21_14_0_10_38_31]|nr:MAG: 30S ribosomal protein S17 [Parcubacteria group bacterium CG10_big_fil_rev_8_21_14_0_10_38_31]